MIQMDLMSLFTPHTLLVLCMQGQIANSDAQVIDNRHAHWLDFACLGTWQRLTGVVGLVLFLSMMIQLYIHGHSWQ